MTRAGAPVYAYRRTTARAKPKRATPEADFQRAVVEYLAYALPPDYRFRAGMEGAPRSLRAGATAKAMGMRKGWPDIMLFNRRTRAIRWLELKSPTGSLTPEQREIAAELGDHMAVCRDLGAVERALLSWGVTPRCSVGAGNRYGAVTIPEP